mmetsp:Transcript_8400/g.13593  ORF Transcript_8400/g.13593 Transcript_8400/m.13593 type:complete len:152 (+) Transcript_8400:73-528(+)
MPNIHGLGSIKKDDNKNGKAEEFSGGGKSSHTAVVRNTKDRPVVVITVYSNGFMLSGDEKFRDYSDPANKKIMDELKKTKQVPKELEPIIASIVKDNSKEVSIEVRDRSSESYSEPKPSFQAFQGQGFSMKTESLISHTIQLKSADILFLL